MVGSLILALSLFDVGTQAASAHGTPVWLRPRLDRIHPAMPGVTIEMRNQVAEYLTVTNNSGKLLEIDDTQGTPFLRVGPSGVDANFDSVDWASASIATHEASRSLGDTRTGWQHLSDEPVWRLFDARLHWHGTVADLSRLRRGTEFAPWTIPIRYGGVSGSIRGHQAVVPDGGEFAVTVASASVPPGLQLVGVNGRSPSLLLRSPQSLAATVFDTRGQPLLRLGPDGAFANSASPDWRFTGSVRGDAPPSVVTGQVGPQWKFIEGDSSISWWDPRVQFSSDDAPAVITKAGKPSRLRRWRLPVDVGGKRFVMTGTTDWQPTAPLALARNTRGMGWLGPMAAGAIAGGAGVGVAAVLRRRRARPPRGYTRGQPRRR